MFTIGDFARHGRVSVRMLRHYDAIGLLRPARIDPVSGYRRYEAAQLTRLNRIVALKELGFTLAQVQAILDEDIGTEQLRGMLRLRQAELAAALGQAAAGLAEVEARLRSIEDEGSMPAEEIIIKALPAVRLAEVSATAASFSPADLGPVIARLFAELSAHQAPAGPDTVYLETTDDDRVAVHAGRPVPVGIVAGQGFQVVTLPAVERAATILHRGLLTGFLSTSQYLVRWADRQGYRLAGPVRELRLHHTANPDDRVAELQVPILTS
jgi:DNA-binding transcriptional MerR regulator